MPWSQLLCSALLILIGVGAFVYGSRLLVGRAALPWSRLRRKSLVEASESDPQLSATFAVIGLTIATITIIGGIGLFIVSIL